MKTVRVLVVALVLLLAPFAVPAVSAWACACGAYSPERGGSASVPRETALVRTDGSGFEDVYLSLTVDSDVRAGALLFPVPDADPQVSAGPRALFATLARIAPPRSQATGGAPGSAGGGVTVRKQQRIGPLDVVTLTTRDPAALARWLPAHGFAAKPSLATAARPYTRLGWAFVAVRLHSVTATAAGQGALNGELDPLHLRFRTAKPVYPMRLSAVATDRPEVTVYTLADGPQLLYSDTPGMSRTWLGEVDPDDFRGELAPLVRDGTTFLTRWDGTLTPATITDDFHFASTRSTPIRDSPVNIVDGLHGDGGLAIVLAWVVGGVALAVAAVAVVSVRRSRRRTR